MIESLKRKIKASPLLSQLAQPLRREYLIHMSTRPIRSTIPPFVANPLPLLKFKTYDAYEQWLLAHAEEISTEKEVERRLTPAINSTFSIPGTCALCSRATLFQSNFDYAAQDEQQHLIPNFREHLTGVHCGFKNRVRGVLHTFVQECAPAVDQSIYITEQFGMTYRWLKGHYPHVSGSEYLPDQGPFGSTTRGIRNEDFAQLKWPDQVFDFILSLEVLEHVPYVKPCFSEAFRCLRPGGRILFSAPTDLGARATIVRAELLPTGEIKHYMEPEYHGGNLKDPSKGTLCFRYFGWDVISQLEEVGFRDAEIWLYWSQELGYMGGTQVVITAAKP